MKQEDNGASLSATGPSQAEPEVSALRASVPSAALLTRLRAKVVVHQGEPVSLLLADGTTITGNTGDVVQTRNPDGDEAANVIERLWRGMRGGNADHDNAQLMEFVADRLVHVHGENRGTDYIIALRERAAMIRQAASGIAARSDETPAAAQPERQEPGPQGDAQPPEAPNA